MTRFADRAAAGDELARALPSRTGSAAVVLAIPNGGVPVAAAVAHALGLPLDVLDVHEVAAHRPDLGVGVVSWAGTDDVHTSAAASLGVGRDELDEKVDAEHRKLGGIMDRLRPQHPELRLTGRCAIVVDEGLGVSAAAAAAAYHVKERGAVRSVLAVPVGVAAFVRALRDEYDDVVCLEEREGQLDLRDFYEDLPPVTEEEVVALVVASSDQQASP